MTTAAQNQTTFAFHVTIGWPAETLLKTNCAREAAEFACPISADVVDQETGEVVVDLGEVIGGSGFAAQIARS